MESRRDVDSVGRALGVGVEVSEWFILDPSNTDNNLGKLRHYQPDVGDRYCKGRQVIAVPESMELAVQFHLDMRCVLATAFFLGFVEPSVVLSQPEANPKANQGNGDGRCQRCDELGDFQAVPRLLTVHGERCRGIEKEATVAKSRASRP